MNLGLIYEEYPIHETKSDVFSLFSDFFAKKLAVLKNMRTFAPQKAQKPCPDGGIGRRAGLKHQWIHFHPGSTPGLGTLNAS